MPGTVVVGFEGHRVGDRWEEVLHTTERNIDRELVVGERAGDCRAVFLIRKTIAGEEVAENVEQGKNWSPVA
jgi:hypothetical protein